jgi:hypothetical protein
MLNEVTGKTVLFSLLFFLVAHICVADALSRAEIAKQFAEEVQRSLPFTTLMPFAWSDAYIGQLVSRKPHFGGGISYGMAMADFSSVRDLLNDFGTTAYMDIGGLMMPQIYGHIRLGGFFVPFDIGILVSIPFNKRPTDGFLLEQQTIGGDIRFALSRDEAKLPGISLGIAYTRTTGRLTTRFSGSDFDIQWEGNAAEIKVQVSKTLGIFTPYFGGGGSFTWSRAGYDVTGVLTEKWGTEPNDFANGVLFRIFGGASMKLWVFRLDVNVNASIPSFEYGVVLGSRFQL